MASGKMEITQAYWLGPHLDAVLLSRNWLGAEPPALSFAAEDLPIVRIRPAGADFIGAFCGYYERHDGCIVFCQEASRHPQIDFAKNPVQVAGKFNRWGVDGPAERWRLAPRVRADGRVLWECVAARDRLHAGLDGVPFKFVSADWQWLGVLFSAPNRFYDAAGNPNYRLEPQRTGRHAFLFEVENGRGLDGHHQIQLAGPDPSRPLPVTPGLSYFDLATNAPLGAWIEATRPGFSIFRFKTEWTVFRLFAPRARSAAVEVFANLESPSPEVYPMILGEDELTWEARVSGNLHGWFYYLQVSGENDGTSTHFDGERRLLDPWALATAGPVGPGIVIDRGRLPRRADDREYQPPPWHDLLVVEGHVRDLIRRAPLGLTADERLGFRGLTKWIAQDGSYLRELGVNALELLPVAQFDSARREDYHWGYMTTNFFAPCSHYGCDAAHASQVEEFAELVDECHRRGLAVILDVVYNHVGEPAFLLFIDKCCFFQIENGGSLANWSGCGNTLRAESAMAKRLIIDSLIHLVETYDVDGFRFDLAELLTVEVLREIENALKAIKPALILIAEPWSFRGSIAWQLRSSGFAFWNDGFRDFIADYVRGHGNAEGLRYFMNGSLDHQSAWPAQSVNYVESHDDRCWLDKITERPNHDGRDPTPNDVHRTHLALAILSCSIGIPMIAAGQDFLRSKHGQSNTHQNGELNGLDYGRLQRFASSHQFCRQWFRFRASTWGELLRLPARPTTGYVRLFGREGVSTAAVLFNADFSRGGRQILFAANPHVDQVHISLDGLRGDGWQELADRTNFNLHGITSGRLAANRQGVSLGPVDCGLWVRHG